MLELVAGHLCAVAVENHAADAALDAMLRGQTAALQPGFAARDQSEVSPLTLDIMSYSVGQ